MITREEIKKLAALSRLELSEKEIIRMQKDMDAILAYVDKLKTAPEGHTGPVLSGERNVLREDSNAHEPCLHTHQLIKAAPSHTDEYVKVKKILEESQ